MRQVSRFATAAVLLVGTASCSQSAQPSSSVEVGTGAATPSAVPAPDKRVELGRFTATMDHTTHKLVFSRVASEATPDGLSLGITPDSLNSVNDPSGVNGNPAANQVDLVTTSCTDNYPTTKTFSCDVEMISGFTRSIANAYVQISNATLDGGTVSSYDGTNDDSNLTTTNDGTLQRSHGLWSYSNASVNPGAAWPVLGPQGSGFNTATRTWDFSNPADENVVYTIVVWATEFWGDYALGTNNSDNTYGNMAYTDACSGGTAITTGSSTAITLPFDFTLYNTNSTTLKVCTIGGIAMGTASCASALTAPAQFPTTTTSNPVFYAFWDRLKFGSAANDQAPADSTKAAGRICYQTLGSAPNRMEVIEWRNMDFTAAPGAGSSLDFEAYLYEGTNEIDMYWGNMADSDSSGRAGCSRCSIGLQGKDDIGTGGSTALTGQGVFEVGGVGNLSSTFLPRP